jgi:hypothetical protein
MENKTEKNKKGKRLRAKIRRNFNSGWIKNCKKRRRRIICRWRCEYKPLVEQKVPPFNVVENPKLLESLALMDGAVIIDKNGMMKAYGIMIKAKKTFKNFGTRHSAGLSASLVKGNTVFVVSEEDRKIRILREGKMIMQIDALQKNVEKSVSNAALRFWIKLALEQSGQSEQVCSPLH